MNNFKEIERIVKDQKASRHNRYTQCNKISGNQENINYFNPA